MLWSSTWINTTSCVFLANLRAQFDLTMYIDSMSLVNDFSTCGEATLSEYLTMLNADEFRKDRIAVVLEARRRGWSYGRIAVLLGVSRQAVQQFVEREQSKVGV